MKRRNKNRLSVFQAGCRKRRRKLASVFCVYFVLFFYIFGILRVLVFLSYFYFMLSVPLQ